MTPTDPVDRTHADSVAAVAAIRAEVARLRQGVAVWVPHKIPAAVTGR